MKLYAIVCEVIIVMDTTGMDDAIKEALKEMACDISKKIISGLSSGVGEVMDGLDKIVELMSGKENGFSCPS